MLKDFLSSSLKSPLETNFSSMITGFYDTNLKHSINDYISAEFAIYNVYASSLETYKSIEKVVSEVVSQYIEKGVLSVQEISVPVSNSVTSLDKLQEVTQKSRISLKEFKTLTGFIKGNKKVSLKELNARYTSNILELCNLQIYSETLKETIDKFALLHGVSSEVLVKLKGKLTDVIANVDLNKFGIAVLTTAILNSFDELITMVSNYRTNTNNETKASKEYLDKEYKGISTSIIDEYDVLKLIIKEQNEEFNAPRKYIDKSGSKRAELRLQSCLCPNVNYNVEDIRDITEVRAIIEPSKKYRNIQWLVKSGDIVTSDTILLKMFSNSGKEELVLSPFKFAKVGDSYRGCTRSLVFTEVEYDERGLSRDTQDAIQSLVTKYQEVSNNKRILTTFSKAFARILLIGGYKESQIASNSIIPNVEYMNIVAQVDKDFKKLEKSLEKKFKGYKFENKLKSIHKSLPKSSNDNFDDSSVNTLQNIAKVSKDIEREYLNSVKALLQKYKNSSFNFPFTSYNDISIIANAILNELNSTDESGNKKWQGEAINNKTDYDIDLSIPASPSITKLKSICNTILNKELKLDKLTSKQKYKHIQFVVELFNDFIRECYNTLESIDKDIADTEQSLKELSKYRSIEKSQTIYEPTMNYDYFALHYKEEAKDDTNVENILEADNKASYTMFDYPYWLKHFLLDTLLGIPNFVTWFYFATPIKLPVIYLPIVVLPIKDILIVIGVGIAGLGTMPLVLVVNGSHKDKSYIFPITMAMDRIYNETIHKFENMKNEVINSSTSFINSIKEKEYKSRKKIGHLLDDIKHLEADKTKLINEFQQLLSKVKISERHLDELYKISLVNPLNNEV